MSRLIPNTTPAERKVGCIFAETFESNTKVITNGGTLGSAANADFGLVADVATTKYSSYVYTHEHTALTVFIDLEDLEFISGNYQVLVTNRNGAGGANTQFEFDINNEASTTAKTLFYFDGANLFSSTTTFSPDAKHLVMTLSGTDLIFYVDGVKLGDTVATSGIGVVNDNLVIGSSYDLSQYSSKCKFNKVRIFDKTLTADEVLKDYNNSTYNYRNEAVLDMPMKMEQYDPTNVRTLDISGNGYHATFGDGSTSGTYPTKLAKRGYNWNGAGNYMTIVDNADLRTANISVMALVKPSTDTGRGHIITNGSPASYAALNYSFELLDSTDIVVYGRTNGVSIVASDVVSVGEYYVVTFTNDGTTTKIYVNGEEVATGLQAVGTDNTTGINMGFNVAGSYKGEILSLQQYGFVLTPIQIADLHIDMLEKLNKI